MPSLLSGINVALQSMLSSQLQIEVTEHNVANANTDGYRRQSVVLGAALPYSPVGMEHDWGSGQVGTGVVTERIQRFTTDFFDTRYRSSLAEQKGWDAQSTVLTSLEGLFAETTADGLMNKLDSFYNNWQSLVNDPTDMALRAQVLNGAKDLAQAFNNRMISINSLAADQNTAIVNGADEVNSVASQVADLNREIAKVLSTNDQPNDLMDKRDVLLDRLSEMTGAVSYKQPNGEVIVSISGHVLVEGNSTFALETYNDANGLAQIRWADDGMAFSARNGELGGMLYARDTIIADQRTNLNQMATTFMNEVNRIHRLGYGIDNANGLDFFTGTSALDMGVNATLDNLTSIATSRAANTVGDGDIARQIADIQNTKLFNSGTATTGTFFNTMTTNLAISVNRANTNSSNSKKVAEALDTQRESISGVNLDEEAANMVKAQRVYQAAARLMTVMDDMLNTVINGMGLVGR